MAQQLETHYDQLQVARTAPLEVIKASYRALSQKYHPDRNPDPDALRIMKMVNVAWDVLSDPARRAKHDRWIADTEQKPAPQPVKEPEVRRQPAGQRAQAGTASRKSAADPAAPLHHEFTKYAMRIPVLVAVGLVLIFLSVQAFKLIGSTGAAPDDDSALVTAGTAVPQGASRLAEKPDPVRAEVPEVRLPHGYVQADRQDEPAGKAAIEIDNTAGNNDVQVRIYRNGRQVRSMFLHQRRLFVADGLPAGTYVIKYRLTFDGRMSVYQMRETYEHKRTDEQIEAGASDQVDPIRVVLFDPANGATLADQITSDQF